MKWRMRWNITNFHLNSPLRRLLFLREQSDTVLFEGKEKP